MVRFNPAVFRAALLGAALTTGVAVAFGCAEATKEGPTPAPAAQPSPSTSGAATDPTPSSAKRYMVAISGMK